MDGRMVRGVVGNWMKKGNSYCLQPFEGDENSGYRADRSTPRINSVGNL
jgi:hypothetical protein